MPISKLSAPQPHELVRKVNELVDVVNSGGGGGGGECAGTLKVATFMASCDLLLTRIAPNVDEGGWNVELGFNVTDNGDGTVTLSDFGFTYDIDATLFRDYWILIQDGDYTDRMSLATFLDALVGMGIIKPNPLYGMGVVTEGDSSGYNYIGFLLCECLADTEDSSPLQDLTFFLSISYLQIGYTIPEITEYEYNPLSLGGVSKTTTNKTTSTSHKTTIIDILKSILEARSNDDIQRH